MGLLALIGLIVVLLLVYNALKGVGGFVVRFGEAVLTRLSSGYPVQPPAGRKREIEDLKTMQDVIEEKTELPKEIREYIEEEVEKIERGESK
jgi:hypothetical protein